MGGVDRGVPGLEVGADVAGVAMAGVDESEVMIGLRSAQTRSSRTASVPVGSKKVGRGLEEDKVWHADVEAMYSRLHMNSTVEEHPIR